ncbi:Dgri\GH24997-PA-like protein [Anopheles sinensis]|uniref:Dgri\GH24997-PA-like protein n=1 Tax=Anopheles sinensis TaxID=74873 RepID=A0A084W816_ANOSI|nr:Dgri\GH24997-PA-like protein [Anopheles sinensis]
MRTIEKPALSPFGAEITEDLLSEVPQAQNPPSLPNGSYPMGGGCTDVSLSSQTATTRRGARLSAESRQSNRIKAVASSSSSSDGDNRGCNRPNFRSDLLYYGLVVARGK